MSYNVAVSAFVHSSNAQVTFAFQFWLSSILIAVTKSELIDRADLQVDKRLSVKVH